MKYKVSIADKTYEVEIEDIHARPIIARVDGQCFEVDPERGIQQEHREEVKTIRELPPLQPDAIHSVSIHELTAPLPGTITEIFVKADDPIESGQVVLVIEAMKMKNSIRSTRAGRIAEILVSAGQTVAHKQALVRFEE